MEMISRIESTLPGDRGNIGFDLFRRDVVLDRHALPFTSGPDRQQRRLIRGRLNRAARFSVADDQLSIINRDLAARRCDRANARCRAFCHRGVKFHLRREIAFEHHVAKHAEDLDIE
jgi:hypothetical protein